MKNNQSWRQELLKKQTIKCSYCDFNEKGYCNKHQARVSYAKGVCLQQKYPNLTIVDERIKKLQGLSSPKKASGKTKKRKMNKYDIQRLQRQKMVKICQKCHDNEDGVCVKYHKWCYLCSYKCYPSYFGGKSLKK